MDGPRGGSVAAVDPIAVAEAATRRRITGARVTGRQPVDYDPYLPGRTVERVSGTAEAADGPLTWTAVVKRTAGPGLRAARRELAAYRHGLAASAPAGALRAPALLAWTEGPGRVELWLKALADRHGGS